MVEMSGGTARFLLPTRRRIPNMDEINTSRAS